MVETDAELIGAKRRAWNVFSRTARSSLQPGAVIRTSAPLVELADDAAVAREITDPLRDAILDARWHPEIFIAGRHDDDIWVAHTGTMRGLFVNELWSIPPSGRIAELRYGEFSRMRDGKVIELRVLADLVGLAAQSGWHVLGDAAPAPPPIAVRHAPTPGEIAPANETERTAALLAQIDDPSSRPADLYASDHAWWGSHGLMRSGPGAADERAIGPGLSGLSTVTPRAEVRIAEGPYGAMSSWLDPSPSDVATPVRMMRFVERRGDRIGASWVLVDLIDAAAKRGVTLLDRVG